MRADLSMQRTFLQAGFGHPVDVFDVVSFSVPHFGHLITLTVFSLISFPSFFYVFLG